MRRVTFRMNLLPAGLLLRGFGLLLATAPACSPPPDTSPAVSITSPVNEQVLAAGNPVDVRFSISGTDNSGPMPVPFALSAGAVKIQGQGKVRAFIDQSSFLAQTAGTAAPATIPSIAPSARPASA